MDRLFALSIALTTLLVTPAAQAKVTHLSPEQRKLLEQPLTEVRKTAQLPPAVLDLVGNPADPGQPWQETDVVMNRKLRSTRLVWGASNGDSYVIHYERGGIAHGYHVLVATWKKGDREAKVAWHAVVTKFEPFADAKSFVAALGGDKLDDDPSYRH
jgi:hypothetical protein